MNRRRFLAGTTLLLAPASRAQDDYPAVVAGRPLQFPRDLGSHPAFRLEWWYVTAWVTDPGGAAYGVQITFFRNRPRVAEANPSRFAPRQLLFAHAALADPRHGRLRYDQRAAREGFGLAEADEESTDVWIDDWSLKLAQGGYQAQIAARDFKFELRFTPTQPILLEGDAGFSRKGPDPRQASAYYSEPQLSVSGRIATDNAWLAVSGSAWLDHEWSSEVMAAQASGWDWTGINLASGGALMAFRMRDLSGGTLWAGGSLRDANGQRLAFRAARNSLRADAAMAIAEERRRLPGCHDSRRRNDELCARAIARRPGARCTGEHRRPVLGRRGARQRFGAGGRTRLSRTDRVRRTVQVVIADATCCAQASDEPLPMPIADDDPPPVPPEPPTSADCCRSGCDPCVFDLYDAALERYEAELAAWRERRAKAAGAGRYRTEPWRASWPARPIGLRPDPGSGREPDGGRCRFAVCTTLPEARHLSEGCVPVVASEIHDTNKS